jgi:hypothetical protein
VNVSARCLAFCILIGACWQGPQAPRVTTPAPRPVPDRPCLKLAALLEQTPYEKTIECDVNDPDGAYWWCRWLSTDRANSAWQWWAWEATNRVHDCAFGDGR